MPTSTLKITVDLDCDRCSTKLQKILCCIQERCEFVIEKVVYKKDKVTVSGPFDANKLSCSLWSKAGRIIKHIEVVDKSESETKKKPKCKIVYPCPYPYPCPQPGAWAWPGSPSRRRTGGCQHSKPPEPLACQCLTSSSCYCSSCQPSYVPPPCSPMRPSYPPMPYPMVVCDDGPSFGTCAVM